MKLPVKRHEVVQPLDQSYRFIPLTQGQDAIVDADDFDWLNEWNWYATWNPCTKSFYAQMCEGETSVYMHRVILRCGPGEEGDHENGNTLDNRRENLRKCTHAQNVRNSGKRAPVSGFKGVYGTPSRKWRAEITVSGKRECLGTHASLEVAARAYDAAAKIHFGKFARLNFPE